MLVGKKIDRNSKLTQHPKQDTLYSSLTLSYRKCVHGAYGLAALECSALEPS